MPTLSVIQQRATNAGCTLKNAALRTHVDRQCSKGTKTHADDRIIFSSLSIWYMFHSPSNICLHW